MQQATGIVVQVSGSTTTGLNKIKQNEGAPPIEITSKLNGDRSGDGLVSFDNGMSGPQGGVMTVATIKPNQKQVSETTVLQMSNIQRASMASNDQRPILTKQKQKIISS